MSDRTKIIIVTNKIITWLDLLLGLGPLVFRSVGPLVLWSLILWSFGPLVLGVAAKLDLSKLISAAAAECPITFAQVGAIPK